VLAKATGGGAGGREAHLREKAGGLLQELKGVGVARHLLWSEYIAERPEGTPHRFERKSLRNRPKHLS
jgi:hypothetical protein